MGVEEEYLLIGQGGRPVGVGAAVVAEDEARREVRARGQQSDDTGPGTADDQPGGDLETEFKQQMLETGTRPCTQLDALQGELREGRVRANRAAGALGASIAALGTFPLPVESTLTPVERYREIGREFGLTAHENLVCGCHVHVGVADDAEGVAVLDRIRDWLPVLLALSANSPFWQGEVSGYQSFRSQVSNRWPTAGPTRLWGTPREYHGAIDALVGSGAILDDAMAYFDARLSARYPTVEIRVADVCLHTQDAALVAALARGLVDTAARQWRDGVQPSGAPVELLRGAMWRAGRSGLRGELVSPLSWRPVSAWAAVDELVAHVGPALEASGDAAAVETLLADLARRGTGAEAQLRWLGERGDPSDVVRRATAATLGEPEPVDVGA